MRTALILAAMLATSAHAQTWAERTTINVGKSDVIVRFGIGDKWSAKTVTGNVLCGTATFADPAKGVVKTCAVVKECLPAQMLGSGSQAVVSSNDVGSWVGWWCPGEPLPSIYACTKDNCMAAKTIAALSSVLGGQSVSAALSPARTDDINSAKLRAVWEPERAKLDALRPK